MMSSVIPARLVFQCGHAALVSLPRIKGETNAQRADRVAREKSAAQTRACDFCAQRLEVVVQSAPAPVEVSPPPPPVQVSAPPPIKASVPPPVEASAQPPVEASTPPPVEAPAPPAAAPPLADWHAERIAQAKPRKSAPIAKPVGRPRRVAAPVTPPVANGAVAPQPKPVSAAKPKPVVKSSARNGRVAPGARFKVEFQVQTVLRAADVRDALRRARALGAVEVLAITQEH